MDQVKEKETQKATLADAKALSWGKRSAQWTKRFSMWGRAEEIRCKPARMTGLLHCVHLSSKGWTVDLTIKTQISLKTVFPKRTDYISKLRYFPHFYCSIRRKISSILCWFLPSEKWMLFYHEAMEKRQTVCWGCDITWPGWLVSTLDMEAAEHTAHRKITLALLRTCSKTNLM